MTKNVKIQKLDEAAIIPTYGTDGSGAFDIYTTSYGVLNSSENGRQKTAILKTGLAFEIPKDHVMLLFSRSSQGFNRDVRLANCVGVIDSDYRGELMIKLTCDSDLDSVITPGNKIAQAMVIPIERCEFEVVDELSETKRGVGGFGSTGQ